MGNCADYINDIVVVYNDSFHSAIGIASSRCILPKEHALPIGPLLETNARPLWTDGHLSLALFVIADLVLKKTPLSGNLSSNKFKPRVDGPYIALQGNGGTTKLKFMFY